MFNLKIAVLIALVYQQFIANIINFTDVFTTLVILDGGFNINIYNNPDRFTVNKYVNDIILNSNSESRVIVISSFLVLAKIVKSNSNEVQKKLYIKNTRLVPDFKILIILKTYLLNLGIYKNTIKLKLRKKKELICRIKVSLGLFFLKNNRGSIQIALVAKTKDTRLLSTATT